MGNDFVGLRWGGLHGLSPEVEAPIDSMLIHNQSVNLAAIGRPSLYSHFPLGWGTCVEHSSGRKTRESLRSQALIKCARKQGRCIVRP